MQSRTCLVTGGTSGVGHAIAASLARRNDEVVITSRSESAGAAAAELLSSESGCTVHAMQLDLADRASVNRFAGEFTKRFPALHVLSLNAAASPFQPATLASGCSLVTEVNYVGHFHLTNLLVDLLRSSAPARVMTVVGNAALVRGLKLDIRNLCSGESRGPLKETLTAAGLKTMFTFELARRMEGTGVTANAFHPGLVKSGLGRELPFPISAAARLANVVMSRTCATGEYLASSPDVEQTTGRFFERSQPVDFEFRHHPQSDWTELWDRTEAVISRNTR
jgi:NAD(P)-dependent dehydrogenase (short-subunit alcohol dehydrogenase family)